MGRWLVLVSLTIGGCATATIHHYVDADIGDAGGSHDAAPSTDAPSVDAFTNVDAFAGHDSSTVSDASTANDAASANDAATANDAASTTDAGNDCLNHGGTCVALAPGTCPAPNMSGVYSCGTGLGVTCCTPGTSTSMQPVCAMTGTANEGWYLPDGTLVCLLTCAGHTTRCEYVGTAQQGWYSTGLGCNGHANEVLHDASCM
jgi:hypothetical protein